MACDTLLGLEGTRGEDGIGGEDEGAGWLSPVMETSI